MGSWNKILKRKIWRSCISLVVWPFPISSTVPFLFCTCCTHIFLCLYFLCVVFPYGPEYSFAYGFKADIYMQFFVSNSYFVFYNRLVGCVGPVVHRNSQTSIRNPVKRTKFKKWYVMHMESTWINMESVYMSYLSAKCQRDMSNTKKKSQKIPKQLYGEQVFSHNCIIKWLFIDWFFPNKHVSVSL